MPNTNVDRDWFRARLSDIKMSQRSLAKHLCLDPAAITLMLRGERRITSVEAQEIAALLAVPVTEILRRAGVDVRDDVRKVPLNAYLGPDADIEAFDDGDHEFVEAPADVPGGSYAVQVRDHTSPHDGWVMIISGDKAEPARLLDRACACGTEDGKVFTGIIKKGYKRGKFNLVITATKPRIIENAAIEWASPILWIKPH
jgi:transcriptional regulator with XRE-family HTH domain